jgi:N-acetylmuramoyl-L-alanine amidase
MNTEPIVLVVAGHGGLNALGIYPRKDKRSPQVPPGIYEGAWNRTTAAEIVEELQEEGIRAEFVNPGPINQPLKSIIGYVNDTVRRSSVPICLLEVHANSDDVEFYDERGWYDENGEDIETGYTIFTCHDASQKSQNLASALDTSLQGEGYKIPSRGVKQANFNVIKKTKCPAILVEWGFMSNRSDVANLQDPAELKKMCRAAAKAIKTVYAVE